MLRNLDFEFGAPFLDNFFSEMSQKIIEKMLSSAWTSIAHFLGRDRFLLCTGQEKGVGHGNRFVTTEPKFLYLKSPGVKFMNYFNDLKNPLLKSFGSYKVEWVKW